jgi:hypothetical protein
MASDPIVVKNFKRLQKEAGVGFRGQRRMDIQNPLREKLNFYSIETQELRKKFPNLTDREFQENFGDVQDFFGALTKEAVGRGHGKSYYTRRRIQGQHAEFLAHISENYYNGNPVFKSMFPKIYDDTIKIWEELINSI